MKKRSLPPALRPYLFVVREGANIQSDFMDYNLQLLDLRCGEIISSPRLPFSHPKTPRLPDFPGQPLDFQHPGDEALFLESES
jgi:hypothetical protein